MFDRILVAVDGSSRGLEAIKMAGHVADRFAAQVELLHVEGALTPREQVLADNRMLEQQVSDLRQHGLHAHQAIEFGRPERAIADLARTEQAQMIVLAPHHRGHLEALWHPRVVARLLGHTAVPLLVVPEPAPGDREARLLGLAGSLVVVPLDGSDLAEHALPYALAFAYAYARPLLLVYVVPSLASVGTAAEALLAEVDYQRRAERDAHGYLSAIRRRLGQDHPGLHIQSMLLGGEPWRELRRCAETHDGSLVVMSTHGRSGPARALLGSVAEHLARACPLPLLIVPPAPSTEAREVCAREQFLSRSSQGNGEEGRTSWQHYVAHTR